MGAGSAEALPASIGAIAAVHGRLFGAAAASVMFNDATYRELYVTQARIITTDIALKMSRVAPKPGPKQFAAADRLLNFCDLNRILMRGHCLIWNEWVPAWIKAMSTKERRMYFDSYIDEVVGRYAGRLQSWDIVNEPFWPGHHAPGGFRMGPWYDAFGPDYIKRVFQRAARVDHHAKFVLNEAQTERDDDLGRTIRRDLLKLVADLKHAGVKLDVVGLEGHLQPQVPHDPARFSAFLDELAGLGVEIYITEFDVRDDTFPDDIRVRDEAVARIGRQFLQPALRHPAVKALITWEFSDKYSFYRGLARQKYPTVTRFPRPLPYDDQMRRKPLWHAIAQSSGGTLGRRTDKWQGALIAEKRLAWIDAPRGDLPSIDNNYSTLTCDRHDRWNRRPVPRLMKVSQRFQIRGALSDGGRLPAQMYGYLLHYFDLPILHAVNGICGHNAWLDRLVSHLALDFKWAVPLCAFWVLWFQPHPDQFHRRKVLIVMVTAVLLALVVNRTISVMVPYRVRPMETAGIGYRPPLFEHAFNLLDFERWSSFPSDQATFFFAFATGFWLLSARLGLAMFAYSTLIILSRVYLGTHFPSDVTVGALLGVLIQLALNREPVQCAVTPLLGFEKSKPAYFNAIMFFILLEMGTGFINVRDIGRSVFHLIHGGP